MPFSWARPESAESPKVYLNFKALDAEGGEQVDFRIEDLSPDRHEDVIVIMRDKHLIDEPMYSSKGVRDEPDSLNEMIENWRAMMRQNISIVCFSQGSDEIVAVNILGVVNETEFDTPHHVI